MKNGNNPLDPIDQALHKKLASSEVLQAPSWDDFVTYKTKKTKAHTIIFRRIYRIGSAAAMVVILITAVYFFNNNTEHHTPLSVTPSSAQRATPLVAQNTANTSASSQYAKPIKTAIPEQQVRIVVTQTTTSTTTSTTTINTEESNKPTEDRSLSNNDTYQKPQTQRSRPANKKPSPFALSAYSALGYGSEQPSTSLAPSMAKYTIGKYSQDVEIQDGQFNHKFPVTFGLAFQYRLDNKFSISTGIMYSYLESTAKQDLIFSHQYTRLNHYLGVPLSVNYSILDKRRVELYATLGAMAEWSLSSKLTSNLYSGKTLISTTTIKQHNKGAIFSANAAFGVNIKILPQVGIYLEPGVSHYFKNSSHPINFRTQWPAQFNLRAGIRIRL